MPRTDGKYQIKQSNCRSKDRYNLSFLAIYLVVKQLFTIFAAEINKDKEFL
jgi:hypothetical protein